MKFLQFLLDGSSELGRKFQRTRLRSRLRGIDRQRTDALFGLGSNAWKNSVDLSTCPELRDALLRLDERQSELAATSTKLQTERAVLESKRKAQVERSDSLARPVMARRSETESALKAARIKLNDSNRAITAAESRLGRLAVELARLETPVAGQPPREQLEAEQKALLEQLAVFKPARDSQTADVTALEAEIRRCREEQGQMEAEHKAALEPIDAGLRRIDQETRGANRESSNVGRERRERLTALGAVLYQGKAQEPALAESIQAVAAVEAAHAETQGRIDASLAVTAGMPAHTMLKFWATPVLLLAIVVLAVWTIFFWMGRLEPLHDSDEQARAEGRGWFGRASRSTDTPVASEESRKDASVEAFLRSPGDASKRRVAIGILESDLNTLGSSTNRACLPDLLKILSGGEPELRAAAASAVGMIGPRESEAPALLAALNDPVPGVRVAALTALGQLHDPSVQLLIRQAQNGESRTRTGEDRFGAETPPDARRLGIPIYPGAVFLYYASDLEAGRAAFGSEDPLDRVLGFYVDRAGRPAVDAAEFARVYLGASLSDPTGSTQLSKAMEDLMTKGGASNKSETEVRAEFKRLEARMLNLPGVRYMDSQLYGDPKFVAVEETRSGEDRRAVRYVAVFRDKALNRTGFEVFITP